MRKLTLIFLYHLQTVAYSILWDFHFLLRNFALIGALLLVLAESKVEGRSLFAGVPSLGENKPKNILQLAGRILLAFMFITLLRFELSVLQVIQDIFGSILMVMVTIGYKTKLSALALVLMLTVLNLYYNAWWSIPSHKPLRDFLKYDFFQVSFKHYFDLRQGETNKPLNHQLISIWFSIFLPLRLYLWSVDFWWLSHSVQVAYLWTNIRRNGKQLN